MVDHLIYALMWAGFGLGHSLLAAESVKARLARSFGPWYRLAYNLFAVLHLAPVLAVGWWLLGDAGHFARPGWLAALQAGAALFGGVVMVAALFGYDLGRFAGTRPIRAHRAGIAEAADESLRTGGLHRYVRHPIYAGALLFLWGRAVDPLSLATAVWAGLYLVIGMLHEERGLLRRYGADYARYRARVPALVPWRGRAI